MKSNPFSGKKKIRCISKFQTLDSKFGFNGKIEPKYFSEWLLVVFVDKPLEKKMRSSMIHYYFLKTYKLKFVFSIFHSVYSQFRIHNRFHDCIVKYSIVPSVNFIFNIFSFTYPNATKSKLLDNIVSVCPFLGLNLI